MFHRVNFYGLLLTAGMLLAGCSKDSGDSAQQAKQEPQEIRVQTNVTSVLEGRRAKTYDNAAGLQADGADIKVFSYFHDTETSYLSNTGETLHYDSSEPAGWKFWAAGAQTHYYWPVEGAVYDPASTNITVSSLDFVGIFPYTRPGYITADPTYSHSTGISFSADMGSYMTNASQADIKEFMCSILPGQTKDTQTEAGGALPMRFQHPFTRLKLMLAASHPDVKIKSITFKTLKTGGNCVMNMSNVSTWSSLTPAEGGTDLVMEFDGEGQDFNNNPATPTPIGPDFIVIPQGWAGVIEVDAWCLFWGDLKYYEDLTTTIPTNWQPGYSYTYTFNISPDDLKVNVAKFTEQW